MRADARKTRRFGTKSGALGPNGLRSPTDPAETYGMQRKSLLSASNSGFIRGTPVQTNRHPFVMRGVDYSLAKSNGVQDTEEMSNAEGLCAYAYR
jgi:hypothetical protein